MIINFANLGGGGGSGSGSTVSWSQTVTAGTQIAQITIDGTSQNVYAPAGGDGKTVVNFNSTSQSERAALYTTLKALYDGGSGDTINRTYAFYKNLAGNQGIPFDFYEFESGGSMVFGTLISSGDSTAVEQIVKIESDGAVQVYTNEIGGGSDLNLEFNQSREIEHKNFIAHTFTHTGSTWGSWGAYVADITNGIHTFRLSINQQSGFRGQISMYDPSVADWQPYLNAVLSRPMVRENSFYFLYPDFYAKYEVDPEDNDAATWTFVIPSGYTIDLKELSPDYTGIEYAGSAETSFTEIAPAGPILINEAFSADTNCPLFWQYIVTHRTDEDFFICGEKHYIQNSTDGDNGVTSATSIEIGGEGRDIYLPFYNRGGQYLVSWNSRQFLRFGKQSIYELPTAGSDTLGGVKVGNGLSIDNNGVLSAKVVALSQADYDALVSGGTVDSSTLYVII